MRTRLLHSSPSVRLHTICQYIDHRCDGSEGKPGYVPLIRAFCVWWNVFSPSSWGKSYIFPLFAIKPTFPRAQAHGKMKREPTLVFVCAQCLQTTIIIFSSWHIKIFFSAPTSNVCFVFDLRLRDAIKRNAENLPRVFSLSIHRPEFSSRPIASSAVVNKWANAYS